MTDPTDIPTLRTERLTLRAPAASDIDAYRAFYASPRSEAVGGPKGEKGAWAVLAAHRGHWDLRGFGRWVVDDGSGAVGDVGLIRPEGLQEVEVVWTLFSGEGRGYATEAARAAIDWAGDRLGPLVSFIDRANEPSRRVAARLGARDTGMAPAHNADCTVWTYGEAA